jgi:hypothetical protein
MRSFSESESEENKKTLYLNQQEAYMMNEHDRMIVQLTSSVVPMTALPKFMRELLEICFMLSKYKDYVKGWDLVAKFLVQNLKNFTNEDLEFYVGVFCLTRYEGSSADFWSVVGQEILTRSLGKQSVMNLINFFVIAECMEVEFITKMVRKLETFELKDYNDFILLAGDLGHVNYPAEDPIWETILSNVENYEVQAKDIPATYLLRAANALKARVQRDSPFYEKVRVYFLNNFKSIQAEYIPVLCKEFVKLTPPRAEDFVQIVLQSLPALSNATQYAKFEFYKIILEWCSQNPNLRADLLNNKQNLGQSFVVPSAELVAEFNKYQSDLSNLKDGLQIEALHENFWLKHAQSVGFNTAFAQSAAVDGIFNYEALSSIEKNLKI